MFLASPAGQRCPGLGKEVGGYQHFGHVGPGTRLAAHHRWPTRGLEVIRVNVLEERADQHPGWEEQELGNVLQLHSGSCSPPRPLLLPHHHEEGRFAPASRRSQRAESKQREPRQPPWPSSEPPNAFLLPPSGARGGEMGERGALGAQPASGADPRRALGGEEGRSHIWVSGARSCCHGAGRLLGRGGLVTG